MSWLLSLYKTYEANLDRVGIIEKKHNDKEYTLLPISHTTQNAHIEVRVTEEGNFHSAEVLDKENTLIPCTDEAASRAGAVIAPYPLHDKLSYVAGDFVAYGGKIKKEEPFSYYIAQLGEWANSPYATPKVKSIYTYLKKGQLIKDLVEKERILFVDENNQLIEKWDKQAEALHGEKPRIFSVVTGGPESAFIRFTVHSSRDTFTEVWKDPDMYDSFISFYKEKLGVEDVCYVKGELLPNTERHANKIRHPADKAKLISANDDTGFTFRGRFATSNEAANISYEVSQKAHNALKWLIHRQAKMIDGRVFLVWGNDSIPAPEEDAYDIFQNAVYEQEIKSNTLHIYAREVAKAIDGYKHNLKMDSEVNLLILDSATTGRMAVLYYRNMNKELYLDRLKNWHLTCVWRHSYRKKDGQAVEFLGAPATKDIAFAAYGPRASDKIVKGLMERMLPCIVDNRSVPKDIIRSAIQRASNPVSMEKWEWEKTLSIACALVNREMKENKERTKGKDSVQYSLTELSQENSVNRRSEEGELGVALDHENDDRDYLFGRLLGIAYTLEKRALRTLGEGGNRDTNAERYMVAFSNKPKRTWKTIHDSLLPYKARLRARGKGEYLFNLIIEVTDKFKPGQFNDEQLSGTYLLGFSSQVKELEYNKNNNKQEDADENLLSESGEE